MAVVDDVRQRRHHRHHRRGRIIINNIIRGHNYIIITSRRPRVLHIIIFYIFMSQTTHAAGLTREITRV